MKSQLCRLLLTALVAFVLAPVAGAQQPVERLSNDEIAKQLANPNTPLATLRLKNLYTFYTGDLPGAGDQSNYSMLFQPSFPFPLGDSGDLILWRPALPILFETPLRPHESIGVVSSMGGIATDEGRMYARLQIEAAKLGADAVIVRPASNREYWEYPKNSGVAIKYR